MPNLIFCSLLAFVFSHTANAKTGGIISRHNEGSLKENKSQCSNFILFRQRSGTVRPADCQLGYNFPPVPPPVLLLFMAKFSQRTIFCCLQAFKFCQSPLVQVDCSCFAWWLNISSSLINFSKKLPLIADS